MSILILGPSGQIGHELAAKAVSITDVVTAGRSDADITLDPLDQFALENLINEVKPEIVINAIAYTAVDKAESDQLQAFRLNSDLPSQLADLCEIHHCLLIHYSTDFVFNGEHDKAWLETDTTGPLSIYGKSKLAGEKAIQISSCKSVILRTSWVYGPRGNNFLLTMLRLARERDSLSVVDDQIGSPTCSSDIADATLKLCKQYLHEPTSILNNKGLYHLSSSGETSWHGFAKAIFDYASEHEELNIKSLMPITSSEYPTDAARPAYSVMNCNKVKEIYNITMPHWKDALNNCLVDYYE